MSYLKPSDGRHTWQLVKRKRLCHLPRRCEIATDSRSKRGNEGGTSPKSTFLHILILFGMDNMDKNGQTNVDVLSRYSVDDPIIPNIFSKNGYNGYLMDVWVRWLSHGYNGMFFCHLVRIWWIIMEIWCGYNGGIEWIYHQTFKNFGLSRKWE